MFFINSQDEKLVKLKSETLHLHVKYSIHVAYRLWYLYSSTKYKYAGILFPASLKRVYMMLNQFCVLSFIFLYNFYFHTKNVWYLHTRLRLYACLWCKYACDGCCTLPYFGWIKIMNSVLWKWKIREPTLMHL